ncbi:MAG: NAD-dependent epimerase/dehydratase family protein [Anaerolineales bacterium]|nr:NAD-dependent epimerase/dehydratase family protein [Anaerolineales bacterium]
MINTLITGGTGFLGGHLARRLEAEGHQVRILAHNTHSVGPESVGDVSVGDIRDPGAVEAAVEGMDLVFHTVSNFRKGGSDERDAYDVNVTGTVNVLKAAKRHGVRQVIHCSTIGVHGDVKEIPADETTPFNPTDLYQETKLAGEREVWRFHEEYDLPVTVIRPISMFGPGDRRMLKLFRMINSGWVVVVGSGETYFQPAYIDDVVDGFVICIDNPKAVGEAFIVGGDEFVTLNTLFSMIAEELGVNLRRIRLPLKPVLWAANACESVCSPFGLEPPLHRRRVSFYQNDRAFSVDKAKRVLGYSPSVSLREAIRRTIEWYRDNNWL